MLLVADVRESHRRLMTEDEQKLFGIEKLMFRAATFPQSLTLTIQLAFKL